MSICMYVCMYVCMYMANVYTHTYMHTYAGEQVQVKVLGPTPLGYNVVLVDRDARQVCLCQCACACLCVSVRVVRVCPSGLGGVCGMRVCEQGSPAEGHELRPRMR